MSIPYWDSLLVDRTAGAVLRRLWRNELQADPAHPPPARVAPGEVDVALVADLALERHLGAALRREEGHLHPGAQRKRFTRLDEDPAIRDVSSDSAGYAAVAFQEHREGLVERSDPYRSLLSGLYFIRTAGHAPRRSALGWKAAP